MFNVARPSLNCSRADRILSITKKWHNSFNRRSRFSNFGRPVYPACPKQSIAASEFATSINDESSLQLEI